ncbi:SH3 domain-containing protein [Pseudalkalibacillus sp. A8]|uniref:SH3 domain-containing protein n=1 Tax=Pseudalkalibacillus sp. A8 TaxID=3382641 RepID=UPI0038B5909F
MKRFGNVFIISLLVFTAAIPATSSVSAANQGYAKINVDTLNVRSGPGLGNSIVAQVHRNREYPILSEKGDWLQIQIGSEKRLDCRVVCDKNQ